MVWRHCVDVTLHDLAALGVVAGDAELRDDLGRGYAELLVDFVLDRQTVAVPAEATQHVAPFHRPVARHDVLQRRRHQVTVVRQPGRERRAVVEDVRLLVARVLERFAEQIATTPEIQNRVFHRHKIERAGWCFSRFRHGRAIVRWFSEGAFYAPLPEFSRRRRCLGSALAGNYSAAGGAQNDVFGVVGDHHVQRSAKRERLEDEVAQHRQRLTPASGCS